MSHSGIPPDNKRCVCIYSSGRCRGWRVKGDRRCKKHKMAAHGIPPDDQRCNRNCGPNSWRCKRRRVPGRPHCEKHCNYFRERYSKSQEPQEGNQPDMAHKSRKRKRKMGQLQNETGEGSSPPTTAPEGAMSTINRTREAQSLLQRCSNSHSPQRNKESLGGDLDEIPSGSESEFSDANPDGISSTSNLNEKFDTMCKELAKKDAQIKDMEIELLMTRHELNGVHKELDTKADHIQDMDSLNQRLLVELLMTRRELKGIRKELGTKADEMQDMESFNQCLMVELQRRCDELKCLHKDAGRKTDQMQEMESLNESSAVELQMTREELEGVGKELIEVKVKLSEKEMELTGLTKKLEETIDETEDMMLVNHALLVKERNSTDELQKVRKQVITGSSDFLTHRTNMGIKRMGELDLKPFLETYLEKVSAEDSNVKAAALCSLWEKNIQNPQWHPFKRIKINGETEEVEVVNDKDEKLHELKTVWGQKVYDAVSLALSELNEYNPSGRYPTPELWNFKDGRKSDLSEIIEYLIKQVKILKSLKRNR